MSNHFLSAVVVVVAVCCALFATDDGTAGEKQGIHVVATTFPVFLLTTTVIDGDDGVKLDLLLPATLGCPHDYAVTPADMRRIATADVIVMNGLGLDGFIDDLVADGRIAGRTIDSSHGLPWLMRYTDDGHHGDTADEDHDEHGHHEEHGHGHHDGTNPHLFASPMMAAAMVVNIARRLGAIRPGMAGLYIRNAAIFTARMTVLDADFRIAVSRLANRRIVTQHGVFDYLARDCGLEISAVIQEHPGSEPAASEMLTLARRIRESRAGAVFAEPQYASRMAETLAREAGIPIATLDPVATGPVPADSGYYERTMRANLATLEKSLGTR